MNFHILPFAEPCAKIRLFFEDEARFGRINEPSSCWAPSGIRPIVPCQMVREYMNVFGATDPISGDKCFIIAPACNTQWMNSFLHELSKYIGIDYALVCLDQAGWHKSKDLLIPDNIRLFYIPPRTPEMNPIEQLWPEVRKDFKNKLFKTLDKVVDQLCVTLNFITKCVVKSVTGRDWIVSMF
jgi:putative transposase